jgi:AraC-like DNA-binding protein
MSGRTNEQPEGRVGSTPPRPADYLLIRRAPSPPLAEVVSRLAGYRETAARHLRQYEAASLDVPLIISFGEPFRIGLGRPPGDDDRIASFVAGLFGGHVVIESFGACHCLQVDFTPLGAYRFFGLPMHELASRMVLLEDLPGPTLASLRERLGEEPDWQRRFDLVEQLILSRIAPRPPASPDIAWAYRTIVRSGGSMRIGTLVDEIGCSRKHLAARFKGQLGLTPKEIARIVRFNRALALARRSAEPDWADVAAACGYADQPHLVREFRALAGDSPTAWRARLS